MSICPNINLPEWQALVEGVGEFEAYKHFLETGGEIGTPEQVMRKNDERSSYQLVREQDRVDQEQVTKLENLTERISQKFFDGEHRFEYLPDAEWKGKVIREDGKDVVVINTALATLDTPLHEFGHIFVAMIRKGNQSLYGRLRSQIRTGKYEKIYSEIQTLYAGKYTEAEMEEEAIVELLGKYAAGLIDPQSTEYNLIQEIWQAIVNQIRKLFGIQKDVIDVAYIQPSTSFEQLANILASDAKITIGSFVKSKSAAKLIPKLEREKSMIELVKASNTSMEKLFKVPDRVGSKMLIADKALLMKLNEFRGMTPRPGQLGGRLAKMMDYGTSDQFITDAENLYNDLYQASTEMRRGTVSVSWDDMEQAMLKKYPEFMMMSRLSNTERDDRYNWSPIESLANRFIEHATFQNAEPIRRKKDEFLEAVKQQNKLFKSLADGYKQDPAAFAVHALNNNFNWQRILTYSTPSGKSYGFETSEFDKPVYKVSISADQRMMSVADTLDLKIRQLTDAIERLKADPTSVMTEEGNVTDLSHKDFEKLEVLHPRTGELTTEKINIQAGYAGNRISVNFSSSIFGFQDAYTIEPLRETKYDKEALFWEDPTIAFTGYKDYDGKIDTTHITVGAFRLYDETDNHVIIRIDDFYEYDKSSFRRFLDQNFNGWSTANESLTLLDENDNEIVDNFKVLKIPKLFDYRNKLKLATGMASRGPEIMGQVMEGISELHYNKEELSVIYFSPVDASITGPTGQIKRAMLYQNYGIRTFGKDHLIKLKTGEIVPYSTLEQRFANLSEQDKEARRRDLMSRYKTGATKIRTKRYTMREYVFEMADTNVIIVPDSYQGKFMTPSANKPLYQLVRDKEQKGEEFSENPSFAELAEKTQDRSNDTIASAEQVRNTKAIEVANQLSETLGIDYEMISEADAAEITKDSRNPWNGEPAFFYGGKVYFIADRLTTDLALHEFSHPLVRHLSKTDSKAFNKLYDQLAQTTEGKAIIEQVLNTYADIDPQSDLFKEEVIVRALTENAKMKMDGLQQDSKFTSFIKNLLFQIKQFLRKVFGKDIPVSKLESITTLNELSDILVKGDKFQIQTELVSDEEFAAYAREDYAGVTSDLEKLSHKDMQNTINTFYDMINSQLNMLLKNENYEELADILADEYQRGDLQQMRSNLSQWQTAVANMVEDFQAEANESRNRVEALANTLFRLETVMEKVLEHVQDISQYPDTQDNMHKAYYYDKFIKYWSKFMEEFKAVVDNPANNVPNRSPLVNLVEDTSRSLRKTKALINEMYALGARDAVFEQMEPINRTLRNRYEKIISDMKERGAPQERIDTIYKEYHGMTEAQYNLMNQLLARDKAGNLSIGERDQLNKLVSLSQKGLSISKDKIEAILRGNMGDANWFNSYLEGYLYNTDPVVGGLALYTKNALNDVMIVSQKKANVFMETMRPLLEKAGYNPMKIAELGEKIGFKDKVAKWNRETGEFEEREVWTFLNRFKNYRYDEDKLAREVSDARRRYAETNAPEDKKVLIDAVAAQKKFERDYMHQEFIPEFYERYAMLEKDDIGKEAAYRRERFFEELRKLTEPAKTQTDQMLIADEISDLWREYRQMHSKYDLNGKLKTGKEAEIAERLRTFKEQSRDFYEWKIRKGVFENAYLDFLQELRNEGLEEKGPEWTMRVEEWKKRNSRTVVKDEWYARREEILENIKRILQKLPARDRAEIDQGAIWKEIIDIASPYRDENNQIIGSDLSEAHLADIKAFQEKLEAMRNKEAQTSGLTPQESERFYELIEKQKRQGRLVGAEWQELQSYYTLKDTYGLSQQEMAELQGYYQELSDMTSREATPYYTDIMNNWLSKLDTSFMRNKYNVDHITEVNASTILDGAVVNSLLGQDAEFDAWFEKNHIKKQYKKKVQGKTVTVTEYKRIYAWNVIKPSDPAMMESYEIKDATGKVLDTVEGLPALDYYARVVKNKYKTRKVVGETVDNRGRFLPKTVEDGALDSRYINEDYDRIKNEQPELFAVLEKMKEFHLKHQEGLSYKSRLYLDYPRFVKTGLEMWQSKTITEHGVEKWNGLSQFIKRIKEFLYGDKAQAEDGFNYEDDFNLVRADMFDNEITDIPISGLYDVEADDVSLDIGQNMLRYMLSAERQKQLVKISPVVRAIQETLSNPENAINDLNRVNEAEFKNRGILSYLKKPDNIRLSAVNNLIAREFEGKTQASAVANVPWLNNFANVLFKRASFSFFALNLPSALKNSLGMKFQSMIEASGGQYVDHISLQKGNGWAYKTMGEISFNGQLYKPGSKSHNIQLVEIFDPIQDRFSDRIGESMSRTMAKDAAEFSWLYSPRKWVEIQANLQLFGGMMYKKKLKQNTPDGEVDIAYIDAFETIDGQIRLKDGIDVRYGTEPVVHYIEQDDSVQSLAKKYNIPLAEAEEVFGKIDFKRKLELRDQIEEDRADELADVPDLDTIEDEFERQKVRDRIEAINRKYDRRLEKKTTITINNSEFKYMKNQIHQVVNNMGGAYAKFDQPEAQRYLFFRFLSYLRRYFTAMAVNRWGFSGPIWDPKPRLNPGLGDVQMGFYIQFAKTMIETIKQGGKNLKYLTDAEKAAMLKFFAEVVMLVGTTMLMSLLFGWDPEDDERYAKLRAKSGALPFPLTAEDESREFDALGYMEVHALHMLMQVRGENEQFNLLTGGIKHYNSLLDLKSVAFGPTTDSYVQLWEDTKAIATGDPKAYYSRDVGPYQWQQQGGSKFMTHLAKTFGLTGSSLDPAMAVQNFQTYQAKVR